VRALGSASGNRPDVSLRESRGGRYDHSPEHGPAWAIRQMRRTRQPHEALSERNDRARRLQRAGSAATPGPSGGRRDDPFRNCRLRPQRTAGARGRHLPPESPSLASPRPRLSVTSFTFSAAGLPTKSPRGKLDREDVRGLERIQGADLAKRPPSLCYPSHGIGARS